MQDKDKPIPGSAHRTLATHTVPSLAHCSHLSSLRLEARYLSLPPLTLQPSSQSYHLLSLHPCIFCPLGFILLSGQTVPWHSTSVPHFNHTNHHFLPVKTLLMAEIPGATAGESKYCLSSSKWNSLVLYSCICGGYHIAQGAIQMSPFSHSCYRKSQCWKDNHPWEGLWCGKANTTHYYTWQDGWVG